MSTNATRQLINLHIHQVTKTMRNSPAFHERHGTPPGCADRFKHQNNCCSVVRFQPSPGLTWSHVVWNGSDQPGSDLWSLTLYILHPQMVGCYICVCCTASLVLP